LVLKNIVQFLVCLRDLKGGPDCNLKSDAAIQGVHFQRNSSRDGGQSECFRSWQLQLSHQRGMESTDSPLVSSLQIGSERAVRNSPQIETAGLRAQGRPLADRGECAVLDLGCMHARALVGTMGILHIHTRSALEWGVGLYASLQLRLVLRVSI